MKCKDCGSCRKGWFKSRPESYVCIGVKCPFVIDDINHDCTEYADRAVSDKIEIVRCPHCDESYYYELYALTTCLDFPAVYKDGELIRKAPHTTRVVCQCANCGKEFSYVRQGATK